MSDNKIVHLFDEDPLDDEEFRKALDTFVKLLGEAKDVEQTIRDCISIPAVLWIDRIGYENVRQNLIDLIADFDKKHGYK